MVKSSKTRPCWCGNNELIPYSPEYMLCDHCKTLVLADNKEVDFYSVNKDGKDFYGKSYWFDHQENELGFGSILSRTRSDLSGRVIYWGQTVLKYLSPPARTLELGCSHGAFVYLLGMLGFDASGLELSPWVVEYARQTFNIPVLLGEIEKQDLPHHSLDAIMMMDVLEHLPDPVGTMQKCLEILKSDGLLFIQTPAFNPQISYEEMVAENHPFLQMLQAPEHIYLFSKESISLFFNQFNIRAIDFVPAYFSGTDMFFVAGKSKLSQIDQEKIDQSLESTPGSRLALALFDIENERRKVMGQLTESEMDREARLKVIEKQGDQLSKLEGEFLELQNQLQDVIQRYEESEADRSARLDVIEKQGEQLGRIEADRAACFEQIQQYKALLEESEADRAARLEVIEKQGDQIYRIEADLADHLEQINNCQKLLALSNSAREQQTALIQSQEKVISSISEELKEVKSSVLYRILHWLGL